MLHPYNKIKGELDNIMDKEILFFQSKYYKKRK